MKNELWKQVSELFQSAIKLDRQNRTIFLKGACGDDRELFHRVRSLVDAHESAEMEGFIEVPVVEHVTQQLVKEETLVGERIGDYNIIKRLGAGGMGEVYLGNDITLDRPIAIKVILSETARDKSRIHRFVQEAKAASALNHPNILTVYHVGDFRGSRFIATEYIKGETLRDKLLRGRLDILEILDIAVQVAAALEAAHAAGIIHRDIKPENLMIRDDGLVKVLDFGLAKLSQSEPETDGLAAIGSESETRDQFLTRAGTILGTVAYMSPEQARGLLVDARSDIWSIGVLIYEMVAGQQPFTGETVNDTIAAILKSEPLPLRNIPAELARIVTKALKKDAGERYQQVKDLLSDLREFKVETEFAARLEKDDSPLKARQSVSGSIDRRGNRTAIAVLPFVNLTGRSDHEYLTDGLTESLINRLSQLPNLTLKARSSVFQYKGREVSPRTIGDELSVEAALFGRVTQLNDLLTLSLELVDTKSGDRIWGELYDRNQTDLPSLQAEITLDVANKLGARLSGSQEHRAMKADTSDPEAYRLYLQGLYHLNKRTAADIRIGIKLFEKAIEKDPGYAKAYASLAISYGTLRPYSAKLTRDELKELGLKRDAAVLRAQQLDDSLPDVHAVLATSYEDAWNFAAAEAEYLRAIDLDPNFSAAHSYYSLNLTLQGRYDEAIAEINKAYELDPFSRSIAFNIGARYADARRFDDAIEQYQRVLEMEPDHPLTHWLLAQAFDAKGMYPDAIAEYQRAEVLLEKESAETAKKKAAALTRALKTEGAEGYWRKRLDISRKEFEDGKGEAYRVAIVLARLGERNQAIEYLERSFAGRELFLRWIRTESAFDAMSDDPRFMDLVRRIGL